MPDGLCPSVNDSHVTPKFWMDDAWAVDSMTDASADERELSRPTHEHNFQTAIRGQAAWERLSADGECGIVRCEGGATVWSADGHQRAAHNAVRMPMHKMINGVARQHIDAGNRVREREALGDEGFERLGDPGHVADDERPTSDAVQPRAPLHQAQQPCRPDWQEHVDGRVDKANGVGVCRTRR
jgi:hypothetical protein